jgi:hypothetical protein
MRRSIPRFFPKSAINAINIRSPTSKHKNLSRDQKAPERGSLKQPQRYLHKVIYYITRKRAIYQGLNAIGRRIGEKYLKGGQSVFA